MHSLKPESIVVLAVALIAITAAVMAFLKTPAEQRLRWRPRTLEQQRDACPADAQAVILRGDWRRALKQDAAWLLASVPLAALAAWVRFHKGDDCAALFGFHRLEIVLAMFFYGIPVLLFAGSLFGIRPGLRLLRGGHWPPLDRVPWKDTLAKTGRATRLRGGAMCLMPVVLLGFVVLSHATFVKIRAGRSLAEVRAVLADDCRNPSSNQSRAATLSRPAPGP